MTKKKAILSNIDLINLCNHLQIQLVDVLSKDKLPTKKIKGLFIINLDDSTGSGTHWVCFSTIPKNVFYYDSFGEPAPQAVDKYIKRTTSRKTYCINTVQMQAIQAQYCGWFCVAVLYLMMYIIGPVSVRMDKIADWLNAENLNDNYDKLVDFFKKVA